MLPHYNPAYNCPPFPDCSVVVPVRSWLLPNAFKSLIMIGSVITLRQGAAYDTPRTSIARARRFNGVFMVIAARLIRQHPLVVLDPPAVALISERPALLDGAQ